MQDLAAKKFIPFRSRNEAYNRRVMVWVCKSCKTWCERTKPQICTSCGGDDFLFFASRAEAKRYAELLLLEKHGQIKNLKTQVRYPLKVDGVLICNYIADFIYEKNGDYVVEDVKPQHDAGQAAIFKLKQKLMLAIHGVNITIIKRS